MNFKKSLLVLVAVCAAATSFRPAAAAEKLNVLFITADDMNANSPGWMGNPLKLTPAIDAFAATAHQFLNNRVIVPICQPSREAIMSGRLPQHSGALGFNPINEGVPTLVTALKQNGYFVAALNKIEHMKPTSAFPWDFSGNDSGKNPQRMHDVLTTAMQKAKDSGKPYFINVNIRDPHRPFYETNMDGSPKAMKAAKKKEKKEADVGEDADMGYDAKVVAHPLTAADITVPDFLEDLPDVRTEIAQYYNSIQRLNLSFEQVLKVLKASGTEDHTVVIFMSDHGMSMPFSKATVYFNGTWSPVLLRWPAMGAQQKRAEFTSSLDLAPTILELLGVPKPEGLDGHSWLPLLKGEAQPDRDYVISNVNGVSSGHQLPQRSVRTAKGALLFDGWSDGKTKFKVEAMQGLTFKAMDAAAKTDARIAQRVEQYIRGFPLAYYDTVKDPQERKNVIDDSEYAFEVERLKKILLDQMIASNDPQLENYRHVLEAIGMKK